MATLSQLLGLFPDNTTGQIDAADIRALIVDLWDRDEAAATALATGLSTKADAEDVTPIYDGTAIVNDVRFDTSPTDVPTAPGVVSWNGLEGTLDLQTGFPGVVIQAGQEVGVRVRNNSGSLIPNGSPVYVTGAVGNRPAVAPATAGVEVQEKRMLGVATADIAKNADGIVTVLGLVRDLNTTAWTEGTLLYLSTTPGGLSSTPSPGFVGLVLRQHVTLGVIGVRVQYRPGVAEVTSSPVGTLTPQFLGQTAVDSVADQAYIAVGLTSADWKQVTA